MSPHIVMRACPGLHDLTRYRRAWLRGDAVAGLTVAAYLVPQVMAYAGVAGLPPVAGLWAAVPALALYAVLGSSRQLSIGPESTTALMSAAAIVPLAARDPERYAALSAGLAILVGLFCLLACLARLGFLADLLSRPVLVGYLAGVAVLMIVGQLHRTTGVPVHGTKPGSQLKSFFTNLDDVQWPTLIVSASVLVFLFAMQARFPRLPGPLLAVALSAVVVSVFGLTDHGLAVVGNVPNGIPTPHLPDLSLSDIRALLLPAVGITIVGYTDNVLTARAFAARGRYDIDANQELLALGAANIGSGLLKGFSVSSSGSRTALGDSAGSRTQLYSLVTLATLVGVLLIGGRLLSDFPEAALGAVIIFAATRLVDVAEIKRIARFRRSELALVVATFLAVLVLNILYGVLIAIGISVADLLRRVARPHDAILGQVQGLAGMHDVDDYPRRGPFPGSSCIDTTRRCSSRMRTTSSGARSRRPTQPSVRSGSCSTWRQSSRWTSPGWTPSSGSERSLTGEASCSRWLGSSRTSSTISGHMDSPTASASRGCSPHFRPRLRHTSSG
jgi:sulfate permease, SulP family